MHSQTRFNCSICEFIGTSVNELNTHMKTHTDEICSVAQLESVMDSPSENKSKRNLSVSPEVVDSYIKTRQNKIRKNKH